MVQWSVLGDLDELELKADEIRDRLREPEVVGQRAIQRVELAGKMAERRIAQFDALLKMHEIEWNAVCEVAIAKSRQAASTSEAINDSP